MQGMIFDIQRFSLHDGPGIRTTVFLKGCPLRCAWCHNPEGVSFERQLWFTASRCIGCGNCFRVCPAHAHLTDAKGLHLLDRERCTVCGKCAADCSAKALELVGREVTVEEVLAVVERDRAFYEASGGGLTLSGGEPLAQIDFAEALLRAAKTAGLHCVVETCGQVPTESLERILGYADLFLYDIKETDSARHKRYTGVGNELILRNLRMLHDKGAKILLRLPTVPGVNDRPKHFEGIARLAHSLPHLLGVEVLPYHALGLGKRDRLGISRGEGEPRAPEASAVAAWVAKLRELDVATLNSA